jgi:UDP-N-acetyl-D-glucosamine dehydrogenase
VIKAAATKPFGFMKFSPSLGVGGHCIPIDPIYLAQKAESVGASAQFIRQANLVNQQMPIYVLKRLEGLLGGDISGKKICIVGISYKPDVTDMRQSPSIVLWQELEKKGALVSFHDEVVKEFEGKTSMALAPNSFDLVVVAVAHSNLVVEKVINSAPIIFDCTGTIKGAYQL